MFNACYFRVLGWQSVALLQGEEPHRSIHDNHVSIRPPRHSLARFSEVSHDISLSSLFSSI
eukprot:scaffold5003_cov101-Skeletonema_dohrnii-CCMP3373.AAC.3